MSVETFKVAGMSCGHCAHAVRSEVAKLAGVSRVDVDLDSGTVTVEAQAPVDPAALAAAIDEAGYDLVP